MLYESDVFYTQIYTFKYRYIYTRLLCNSVCASYFSFLHFINALHSPEQTRHRANSCHRLSSNNAISTICCRIVRAFKILNNIDFFSLSSILPFHTFWIYESLNFGFSKSEYIQRSCCQFENGLWIPEKLLTWTEKLRQLILNILHNGVEWNENADGLAKLSFMNTISLV